MRTLTSTATSLALVLTLAACSGAEEDPNLAACDAFAYYLQDAGSVEAMDRQTTIEQVDLELGEGADVDQAIAVGLETLENTVDSNDSAWTLAADTMAGACTDYGWTAD